VLDVSEAHRIRSGDILVTKQTDPGWASVFFLVKGLVIERGGMLSHGAIIAREYGIPAVVGVANASSRIRDGAEILINADQAWVELVNVAQDESA
jgi:pyruvate,water dikinase